MNDQRNLERAARKTAKEQERQDRTTLKEQEKQVEAAQKFNRSVEKEHATWSAQIELSRALLDQARNYKGIGTSDSLVLKAGEALYLEIPGALIEDRVGQTNFVSGHQGVSIPLFNLNGHAVRYNVGATRGHIERPAPTPTIIDTGIVAITNQRIVFIGAKQTRECLFTKLVSIQHPRSDMAVIAVSNRQKPTVLKFSTSTPERLQFIFLLATAEFQGTRDALVESAASDVANQEKLEPKDKSIPIFEPITHAGKVATDSRIDEEVPGVIASRTPASQPQVSEPRPFPELAPTAKGEHTQENELSDSVPSEIAKEGTATRRNPRSIKSGFALGLAIAGLVFVVFPVVPWLLSGPSLGLGISALRKAQGSSTVNKISIVLASVSLVANIVLTIILVRLSQR